MNARRSVRLVGLLKDDRDPVAERRVGDGATRRLTSRLAHLDRNRLTLHQTKQSDLFDVVLDIAQTRLSLRSVPAKARARRPRPTPDAEVDALADWLCKRTQLVVRGERDLTYKQLRQVIKQFDYDFDSQKGSSLDVIKL